MADWYSRPVFFVRDAAATLGFFVDSLGFEKAWGYEEDGKTLVAQANRGNCEVILATDAARAGSGRLFVELEASEVPEFQAQLDRNGVASEQAFWGYPVTLLRDPDGNEMMFCFEQAK